MLDAAKPLVEYVGEVGGRDKAGLLAGARTLLFPIDWAEPFGLVMIEALACGTPVIGWRRGSVPEVLDEGRTGFIVDSVDEAVSRVGRIDEIERARCRAVFEERFDAGRMARDYLAAYRPYHPVSVMTENAGHSGPSHLLAASLAAGDQPRVLKHADTFGVFDQHGDVTAGGLGEEGLYDEGTRFLSLLTLEIEGARPFYLDSAVAPDNDLLTITLTNPDLVTANGVRLPLATIHLALTRFLWRRTMFRQDRITNYYHERVDLALGWHFAADYTDIYDVRGPRRQTRGADLQPIVGARRVTLGYDGRDGVQAIGAIALRPGVRIISPSVAHYALGLEPRQEVLLRWDVSCQNEPLPMRAVTFPRRARGSRSRGESPQDRAMSHRHIARQDEWLDRASDCRSQDADDQSADRPISVCRRPLVQHALRPRRADHGLAMPLAPACTRARRARLPCPYQR